MNHKMTYTEVLEMINSKMEVVEKLDKKLDKLDDKLNKLNTRLTVVETEAKTHKGWVLWLWGGVVTVANLARTTQVLLMQFIERTRFPLPGRVS